MYLIVMEVTLKGRDEGMCLGISMRRYDFTNIYRGTFSKFMGLVCLITFNCLETTS